MLYVTVYVTVAVRKHVMVAVSPHVTAPGRVCVECVCTGICLLGERGRGEAL